LPQTELLVLAHPLFALRQRSFFGACVPISSRTNAARGRCWTKS
jgi:hypothetical protein